MRKATHLEKEKADGEVFIDFTEKTKPGNNSKPANTSTSRGSNKRSPKYTAHGQWPHSKSTPRTQGQSILAVMHLGPRGKKEVFSFKHLNSHRKQTPTWWHLEISKSSTHSHHNAVSHQEKQRNDSGRNKWRWIKKKTLQGGENFN